MQAILAQASVSPNSWAARRNVSVRKSTHRQVNPVSSPERTSSQSAPQSALPPLSDSVLLYDTTLRDGAQMVGMSLSGEDKVVISRHLIDLGVSYIEGGWPGSNLKDAEFFARFARELGPSAAASGTRLAAFGSTRRRNAACDSDPQVQALIACEAPCITLVAKTWSEQVEKVIGTTREENLLMIEDTVQYFKARGREVALDAEHFFDGAAADRQYAMDCLAAAAGAGADFLVLCDTNGAAMPWDVEEMVRDVAALVGTGSGGPEIGIHCHNDGGLAVANSLSAVRGGARMVQGCMNGYGERTGNADLIAIAGDLETKMRRRCLPDGALGKLTAVSRAVAAACRIPHSPSQPYAGAGAFAHKGGLHVAAIRKMPSSYNHIDPSKVGNEARTVVSELSGRGNVQEAAIAAGLPALSDATAATVLAQVKALENAGAAFEAAPASVEMLIARCSDDYVAPFHVREFNVMCSNRSFAAAGDAPAVAWGAAAAGGEGSGSASAAAPSPRMTPGATAGYKKDSESVNTAWVKVELPDGVVALEMAEGNGPVNALAQALKATLANMYPALNRVRLTDYRVDLLGRDGTSAAVTRVSIDFEEVVEEAAGQGAQGAGGAAPATATTWRTVGAHSSILEASFRALVDGLEWAIRRCDSKSCALPPPAAARKGAAGAAGGDDVADGAAAAAHGVRL